MTRLGRVLCLVATVGAAHPVAAQPTAPATPRADGAEPVAADPAQAELDDAVALALIARARALVAEGAYADAKQLVVEALIRSPSGASSAEARELIDDINAHLGILDAPPIPAPAPVASVAPVAAAPMSDAFEPERPARPAEVSAWTRYGGGVVGGGVAGGLLADVLTGTSGTTEDDVSTGALLGAVGGGVAAYLLDSPALTARDHWLIDSMATWGLVGGMTLAAAIDPPEGEAYSLNGVLGIAGGYLAGHLAARRSELSARRLAWLNVFALGGAAAPWLLYGLAADSTTSTDEQVFGALSTVGLVAGAYLGLRWTRGMTSGAGPSAPPTALLQRGHRGWEAGGLRIAPARGGAALSLVAGTW